MNRCVVLPLVKLIGLLSIMVSVLAACESKPVPDKIIDSDAGYSDVEVNIQVGHTAPDFSTTDANGNVVSLEQFQPDSNVMLIFYRGNWCPFCVSHLDDIQNLFPTLVEHNIQLLAISPDDAADSQKLADKFSQPYVFLSDPDLAITDSYGIRRDEKLPHPAVVLIDREGDVAWFYVGEDYKLRPSAAQLKIVIEKYL